VKKIDVDQYIHMDITCYTYGYAYIYAYIYKCMVYLYIDLYLQMDTSLHVDRNI
jgi:hypothetical protein